MQSDEMPIVELIYIVKQNNNLTAYDDFNEDTFTGPTNVTDQVFGFLTEEEAMKFFERQKAMLKFAGSPGMYYTYPVTQDLRGRRTVVIDCKCDEGGYYKLRCPAEREICSRCDGNGTHVNPAVDGDGISPEEFHEDPDFAEAYMRGDYDVQCEECKGERIVSVPDVEKLPENLQEDYWRYKNEDAQFEAEESRRLRNLERGIHS